MRPAPSLSAYQRALRRLARRDHSEGELRRSLRRAGHSDEEVEAALLRLRSQGYLDDETFAGRFARSRLANQAVGQYRIRAALRARGVPRETAERGLAAALEEVPEPQVVEQLARQYWQRHASDEPERRMRRLWASLVRRGFPAALVSERLRALWPRWRDALEGLEPADELGDD